MIDFSIKFTLLSLFGWLALFTPFSVQAKPILDLESNLIAQDSADTVSEDPFQQAKADLPEDWYVLYRIVDRIARANGLDNNPWRIVVIPEYNINAFATDVNLIAIYSGIIDQLAGDASALACVVGHEMTHHIQRHIAVGEAEKAALLEKIQQEAEQEVNAEKKDARNDATTASVGGGIVRGVVGGILGNAGGTALENESRQRLQRSEQRVQEIVTQKQEELEQKIAENNRKQEFEADELGYQYMVRAGFEPEGCLRVMEVLGRTPGAEFDTTHPAIPKRIQAIRELMVKHPPERLIPEGEATLSASTPLTYDLSQDGMSLRINSRRGGRASDDIERLFDQ